MQPICNEKKNMPANLNALIRYRTIDKCLANPYRKWTIVDLMEECSIVLEENRGIYSGISERTIREDIRVMRSDILGFNAPIVQKEGNYYYEDRSYSIFNVNIKESELLGRILNFIREIQSEIQHPDMEDLIRRISLAVSEHKDLKKPAPEKDELSDLKTSFIAEAPDDEFFMEEPDVFGSEDLKTIESEDISWASILNLL
jgi:hypothetical protein